jgi:hypothetical protein
MMAHSNSILSLLIMLSLLACQPATEVAPETESNPASEGFNIENSDPKAIAIADEVMEAMGGRKAWDNTQYLSWTFFGNRQHIWDKTNQRCRIYSPKDDLTVLINLKDQTGSVKKGSEIFTDQDSIAKYVDLGMKWWINDSYWLVMPFKLKDSGVTLKFVSKDTTQTGKLTDVLQLTFEDVGVTPENKYLVYVDDSSRLITQWDYYSNYTDSLPRFQSPWPYYEKFGELLLSGGTIGDRRLTDISVAAPDESVLAKLE